jgi:hypothetical protein
MHLDREMFKSVIDEMTYAIDVEIINLDYQQP